MLVLLGKESYFRSINCLKELTTAKQEDLLMAPVHEWDRGKNGAPLSALKSACHSGLRPWLFGTLDRPARIIPWHRMADFQLVSIAQIAETVLVASPGYTGVSELPLYVPGRLAWTWPTFSAPLSVYVSQDNPGAAAVLSEMTKLYPEVLQPRLHSLIDVQPPETPLETIVSMSDPSDALVDTRSSKKSATADGPDAEADAVHFLLFLVIASLRAQWASAWWRRCRWPSRRGCRW